MESSSANPQQGVTDAQIFRRALGIGLVGVLLVIGLMLLEKASVGMPPSGPSLDAFAAPAAPALKRAKHQRLHIEPLTPELRARGYHECNPPDPLGLGPYSSYRTIAMGARMLIPQKGGHTADMGYDVIVHFHGHEPARKMLVQVARGVVYVGLDEGLGSGPYADAFQAPGTFPRLLHSITAELKDYSGDDRAHIRHLALSAWSAGYGAVNEILKHGRQRIGALVLLDALHAGWKPGHRHDKDGVSSAYIQPVFDFARRAMHGHGIFIFTHSQVDPVTYPSTTLTADLMLSDLGLQLTPVDSGDDRFGMTGRVDVKGFHLWSYRGANEDAHCAHLEHLAPALAILEGAWDTPAMDRDVPFHRAPKLGTGEGASARPGAVVGDAGAALAEPVPLAPPGADGGAPSVPEQSAQAAPVDNGSLQPVLLDPGSAKKLADPGAHDPLGVSGPPSVPPAPKRSGAAAAGPLAAGAPQP